MLIICNGTFKSGSSWLHAILVELTTVKKLKLQKVPEKYTNDINSPTTIIESRLGEFLNDERYKTENFLTKAHFFKQSTLRSQYPPEVKMLFIERDMRDAIVSHYFHIRNKYRFRINFVLYYYFLGRYKVYEISLFNNRCRKYMGEENFFHYEMGNISYYPTKRDDNWKLFREGKVGGWESYFKKAQIKDVEKIESGMFSLFSKIIYFLMFTLRRVIFKIE